MYWLAWSSPNATYNRWGFICQCHGHAQHSLLNSSNQHSLRNSGKIQSYPRHSTSTMAETNQNGEAQLGSQPQQGETMAQSQERRKRTTQRKKPGHWRKLGQPTIDGSKPFNSSQDCIVCRAEALGTRKPKRAHHPRCPRNTKTRGKEICEQSIKVQKAMEHNLKVNAVKPTGWHNPTAEEFKSFFAMRRGTTTRNNSTCGDEHASISVVDPFKQLYEAVLGVHLNSRAFASLMALPWYYPTSAPATRSIPEEIDHKCSVKKSESNPQPLTAKP